jgi:tRNA G18 (ribose-2'-O)-methylase SpoU
MEQFTHLRHKPPATLPADCELVLACPTMRSNVNLSRIVRAASCSGVRRMIVCGAHKIDPKIARDGAQQVVVESRRSLPPVLKRLRDERFQLVGLEQTTNSQWLSDFSFAPQTVLVIGHERLGLEPAVLSLLDAVVEIPVFGLPHSFNVATATAMALYEYCRQHGRKASP